MGFRGIKATALTLLIAAVGIGGCKSKMHDENLALHRQNRELQEELDTRGSQPAADTSALEAQLAAQNAKIAELEAALRQPTPGAGAQPGIEGIQTSYDAQKGEMTVTLPGDILFDSGQDAIKGSAKATLDKVANALKTDYAGKRIRVEGHSDTDPINKTKGRWKDNLELSIARAAAVTRYLAQQGVPQDQMVPSGFGSKMPKQSKEASRRVEIVVVTG